MPGLVKIGLTRVGAAARAKQLFNTSVPQPFVVEFALQFDDAAQAEKTIHQQLAQYRVHPRREYFRVSPAQARAVAKRLGNPPVPGWRKWLVRAAEVAALLAIGAGLLWLMGR